MVFGWISSNLRPGANSSAACEACPAGTVGENEGATTVGLCAACLPGRPRGCCERSCGAGGTTSRARAGSRIAPSAAAEAGAPPCPGVRWGPTATPRAPAPLAAAGSARRAPTNPSRRLPRWRSACRALWGTSRRSWARPDVIAALQVAGWHRVGSDSVAAQQPGTYGGSLAAGFQWSLGAVRVVSASSQMASPTRFAMIVRKAPGRPEKDRRALRLVAIPAFGCFEAGYVRFGWPIRLQHVTTWSFLLHKQDIP